MGTVMINKLNNGSDLWKIIARVQRRWFVYEKASPGEIFCATFLLHDREGNQIQVSAIGQSLIEKCVASLHEGRAYRFESFKVKPNTLSYRASTHPFMITFTPKTFFVEVEADLPLEVFKFKPISELKAVPEGVNIEYLFDVVGFVKTMGRLEEFPSQDGNKTILRMILSDADDNEIECVLFDDCASDACLAQNQNSDTDSPIVALINLARLTWNQRNGRQIASSYEATRVLFNHDIPEVKKLLATSADRSTPIVTQFAHSMPSQRSRVSNSKSLHGEPKIPLDKIKDQNVGKEFVVSCQLLKFQSSFDWCYDGCSKCNSKPKPIDKNDPNSTLYCSCCRKAPERIEPKMKLTFTAKDDSGIAQVTFWDETASQLLGKTIDQFKLELPEGRTIYDSFPDELREIEGKKVLLELKRNQFHFDNPKSSISVCHFTICEDLLEEFNSASTQDAIVDHAPPVYKKPMKVSSCSDSTPTVDLSEDDTSNTNNDTPAPQTVGKGKRRNAGTNPKYQDSSSNTNHHPGRTRVDERLLKNIKQEKLN